MAGYNFVGPAYTGRHRQVAWEECLNLFVETVETAGAKNKTVLYGTPGTTTSYPAFAAGTVRGMYVSESAGHFYVVAGNTLYRMPDAESDPPIAIATISAGNGFVDMCDDGRFLTIVDGSACYTHRMSDDNSGLTTPLSGGQRPTSCVFIGGYTVVNNTYRDPSVEFPPTDSVLYYSNLFDATKYYTSSDTQSYDFFTAESNPDPVYSLKRVGDELWALGPRSYEVFGFQGDVDPNKPFTKVGGSASDIGCAARYSAAVMGRTLFWLGTTKHGGLSVYRSNGYGADRISTYAVEQDIGAIDFSDAIGWCYQEDGHDFYVLTMRGSKLTYVWDDKERAWHKRASRVSGTDEMTIWEPIFAVSRGTTTYCGSNLVNRVLKLSMDAYTEWDGRPIKRVRSGPVLFADNRMIAHKRFWVEMLAGVGTRQPGTPGYDPKVMMRYSDDGGNSWSNEYEESFGRRGHYDSKTYFNRLGCSRDRTYEVTVTAPVPVCILGAAVETGAGER